MSETREWIDIQLQNLRDWIQMPLTLWRIHRSPNPKRIATFLEDGMDEKYKNGAWKFARDKALSTAQRKDTPHA